MRRAILATACYRYTDGLEQCALQIKAYGGTLASSRRALWIAAYVWVLQVAGSNPAAPTTAPSASASADRVFLIVSGCATSLFHVFILNERDFVRRL
jgi:hypothetical protein